MAKEMTGREELIAAIASRQWTARELSNIFNRPTSELREFVESNREAIEEARQAYEDLDALSSSEIEDLWIARKAERLKRIQRVAESLYVVALRTHDSTILRELRSYLFLASNELGQLMHRGSGASSDDATASYTLSGVDLDNLR